ncbi:MAG: hypothetical protein HQ559_14575, partial [Lentisphaerae bacterium]|nr:hypothetical protein [Lentisphaerota bacterium]
MTTGNTARIVLDLGEPPGRTGNVGASSILFAKGAANGTRVAMDKRVLPSTENFLHLLDAIEERWRDGDFSVATTVLWLMPENGFYQLYCRRLSVDPEEHLLEILQRAKGLNDRYGAWRVILQMRGELDSCFVMFPAPWKDRGECHGNWDRFNNTDLCFERYRQYGAPLCWQILPEDYPIRNIVRFLEENNL